MRYALVGYGKMGRAIEVQAEQRGHRRVAVFDSATETQGLDRTSLAGAEVAFEFTEGPAAESNVVSLLRAGVPVVCGTTGWQPGPELERTLETAEAGLVLAANFSVGVNVFFRVVEQAARAYGALGIHDPYVHEVHHRGKRDVPSGTARQLASIVLRADPRLDAVQEGNPDGVIPPGTLHVTGTRAGTESGTHTVGFDGPHDQVTLRHRARGREGFALGAVLAGEWIVGRRGRYGFEAVMQDVLARGRGAEGGER